MSLHQVLLSDQRFPGRYCGSKQLEEISEIQASFFQSSSNNEDTATSKSTSFFTSLPKDSTSERLGTLRLYPARAPNATEKVW